MTILYADFETRSACDLKRAGAIKYSMHPTTTALCLAYAWDDEDPYIWWPELPFPEALANYVRNGGTFEAHNSGFELAVWNNAFRRQLGFGVVPELRQSQMLCSAAKAANCALPRDLATACRVLETDQQKDKDGHRLMLKLSKPRRPRKDELVDLMLEHGQDEDLHPPLWHEDPAEHARNRQYCLQDVRAERSLSKKLPEMSRREIELWRMDQRLNWRGIRCDMDGVRKAIDLTEAEVDSLAEELRDITGGAVRKPSNRMALVAWSKSRGVPIANTQADYLKEVVETYKSDDRMPADVHRALEICVDANRTSTSKYKQMVEQACDDGRLRDMMMYYGAPRTGRWSGKGVQPHNFVRGYSKTMEDAWDDIHSKDRDRILLLHSSMMDCLAKSTRGALVADEGKDLMVADYAAVEARVLLWLADDQDGLDIFRRGEDIYIKQATDIYGRPITKADKIERQLGKKAILGLGYEMGAERFDDECAQEGILLPREFFQKVVTVYREESFPKVASLWRETEEAAVKAVRSPRVLFNCRLVDYQMIGRYLCCRLPSGRLLRYRDPRVRSVPTWTWRAVNKHDKEGTIRIRQNEDEREQSMIDRALKAAEASEKKIIDIGTHKKTKHESIVYWGMNQKTRQWCEIFTYGGTLVENNVQATARDFLADAMLRCDLHPLYDLLLSIHDEIVCEVDRGKGDLHEFEEMMSASEPWGQGCPIRAEGWRGTRYRK